MIIRIYSDSLGLPRPGSTSPQQCYFSLLRAWYCSQLGAEELVFHAFAKGGGTISELSQRYSHDNFYFGDRGDVLIIHCGICDCAPRPIPPVIRRIISRTPAFLSKHIICFLHKNRAALLKRGFCWRNTNPENFEKALNTWILHAANNFKRIYVIGIAPTNSTTENHSPGLSASIIEFNQMMQRCVLLSEMPQIVFIDAKKNIEYSNSPIDEYILKEDGHHLTAKAHEAYFSWIRDHEIKHTSI